MTDDKKNDDEIQNAEQEQAEPTLEDQISALKDQYLRALADAENIRRRSQKEREDASKYAIATFAKSMIDVADNVERAIALIPALKNKVDHTADQANFESFFQGIEMIMQSFQTTFEQNNIKKIQALHQSFDPNLHQALMEIPSNEHPSGTVIQIIQEGYQINDRLLRPSLVGVSKSL